MAGDPIMRRTTYWGFTLLLAAWLAVGGCFDLVHAGGAVAILRTLGYPEYLCSILGPAKLLAIPALVLARVRGLQEWAYAGITFDGLGAFASHLAVQDGVTATLAPLVFLMFAALSYMLRPVSGSPVAEKEQI
jgi:DoxX-like family